MARNASITVRRQWRILIALAKNPRTIGSLARQHGVSKATAQRDVSVLASVFQVRSLPSAGHKQRRMYQAVIPAGGER